MPDDAKRRLLAVFPHPDDEFAVFPWLRAAARGGREIHCIWLTDGGFGGQDIERRNEESRRVLQNLGLDPAHMHFVGAQWNVPDGQLHLKLDQVVPMLLEQFGELAATAELLIPAWEGGHHDHDAAHLVGLALASARGEVGAGVLRQYPIYNGEGLRGPLFRMLSPLAANGRQEVISTTLGERFGHALRCTSYGSQWRSLVGLLPMYLLRMLRADAFVLQPVDASRTATRPHQGLLLYERRGGPTWAEFAACTGHYRS